VGVSLVLLFLASQVFPQPAPIEGWDKAKLGMSIEELKESYREEAKFFEIQEERQFWEETTPPEMRIRLWVALVYLLLVLKYLLE